MPRLRLVFVATALLFAALPAHGASVPQEVAAHVDRQLAAELGETPGGTADDETFLRRLSFDLVGQPPTPQQITALVLDPSADKRRKAAERLLDTPAFGQNWARYWRDVVFARRTEDRALIGATAMVVSLTERFNRGAHWDEIARGFVTALGDVREEGSSGIILAQMASPVDTAAEVSRIFLGIQIQCAQCHNHPTDRWQRRQFHELAAFFPRIGIRPRATDTGRSFAVVSLDRTAARRSPGVQEPTTLEHYMPDLENPKSQGTVIQPAFFVTGAKLPLGLSDVERRRRLAEWMTAPTDRWFAKAYVNRMWTELTGQGFYDTVDDLGPDRPVRAAKTLDYLTERFVASRYDVKWLFKVITATEAYGAMPSTVAPAVTPAATPSSASSSTSSSSSLPSCARRLRADQLFNVLASALEIDESLELDRFDASRPRAALRTPRGRMNQFFGYDPSLRSDEINGSIPQALWLMNAPELQRSLRASGGDTSLSKLVARESSDRAVAVELYLRFLARQPSTEELQVCLDHVRGGASRSAAFEDVAWCLVNSTEFLHRK